LKLREIIYFQNTGLC